MSLPLTIGHYAPRLWARGGIASYVGRLTEAQRAAGHRVHTFSLDGQDAPDGHVGVRDSGALFAEARRLGLDVLHLHKPVARLPSDRVPTLRTMHGHQASCPSATRFLARTGTPCDRTPSLAACTWGHLVDRCGSRRPERVAGAFAGFDHERALASQMETVAVSRFLRDRMVEAGCDPARLHVIPSPAPEPAPFAPPPATQRFAFLGRLVPQKGLAWTLRALARVDGVHLDVAGEGPERAALEALAQTLGVADRVVFHGWLAPADARQLLLGARAAVVPSMWHEPAGLVSLEAAACGRAVIGSRAGGIPEYAGAEAALLVAPGDVDALARAVHALSVDHGLAERLGRAGLDRARRQFSMDTFMSAQDRLYRIAIEAHAVPQLSERPSAHSTLPASLPFALSDIAP